MSKGGPRVASVYTAFHLYRNVHDAKEGDVTVEEQIKAAERFIRWHERQVTVGKQLLEELRAKAVPAVVLTDVSDLGVIVPAENPAP